MIYKPCYFGLKISLQTKQITVKCLKWKLLLIDIIIIKSQINKKTMNLLLSMLSMTPLLLLGKTPMRQHRMEKIQCCCRTMMILISWVIPSFWLQEPSLKRYKLKRHQMKSLGCIFRIEILLKKWLFFSPSIFPDHDFKFIIVIFLQYSPLNLDVLDNSTKVKFNCLTTKIHYDSKIIGHENLDIRLQQKTFTKFLINSVTCRYIF